MSLSFKGITYITSANPIKTNQFTQALIDTNYEKNSSDPPLIYSLEVPKGQALFTDDTAKLVSNMGKTRALLCNNDTKTTNQFCISLMYSLYEQERLKGNVPIVNLDTLA